MNANIYIDKGKKKIPSSIVLLLTIYVVGCYVTEIDVIKQLLPYPRVIPGLALVVLLILMGRRSLSGLRFGLFPKLLLPVLIYLGVLLVMLFLLNLNALRPVYSTSRSVVAVLELSILFLVSWQSLEAISLGDNQEGRIISWGLLGTMLALLVGQLLIPEWRSGIGGIRMSGGANPNQLGFFAFFGVVWAHYISLKKRKWDRLEIALYALSTIAMVWSLSRTVIFGWLVLYGFYFSCLIGRYTLSLTVRPPKIKSIGKLLVVFVALAAMSTYLASRTDVLQSIINAQKVEQRLAGSESLQSRLDAWQRLWNYFERAPATGSAGWWNSTNLLPYQGTGRATSPHNLYVRILSEVGIIGLISVLLYPAIVSVGLLSNILTEPISSQNTTIYCFVLASILSVFAGQLFEDRYMVGVMSQGNAISAFVMTIGLHEVLAHEKS
jgi:hypothetical protein